MSLPVPDLDDRRFQDLVDEAKRMIPTLTPEWTNHNVADPGVALIELFAWMSEQVIYRLNQVPERLYVDFLNLLGTSPFPSAPARVPLTFWLSGVPGQPVVVPRGTEVTTSGPGGVVFATTDELRIVQPRIEGALNATGEMATSDVLEALRYDRDTVTCFASNPVRSGDALLLGFDTSLAGQLLELTVRAASRGVGVDPERVPIVWEVWSGEHWITTEVITDTTGGLNRTGSIRMVVPPAHEPLVLNGQRLHWLRVRLIDPVEGQPTFTTSPTLTSIEAGCLGGTVVAEHSRTVVGEVVGSSDGTPGQRFELASRPILPRRDGEHVIVSVDGEERIFTEVADFAASGPQDQHMRFDASAGAIEFGPRIRYPDGTSVQHGAVPPFGARITLTRYRTGGGTTGNVGADTLTVLRSTVPFIDRVGNLQPARGGVDPESVDEVKVRGPRTLRTGQRAVTPSDYEQLTLESSPQVARARCLVPGTPTDPIGVLVVPTSDRDPHALDLDDLALSAELFATIRDHLDERRTLGAAVSVTSPYYQGVSIIARVRAASGRAPAAVRERVLAELARYLSPLEGGPRNDGWPYDHHLSAAHLVALLEDVVGVSAVDEVALFEYDLRNRQRLGTAQETVTLDHASLFLSGGNQVVVR